MQNKDPQTNIKNAIRLLEIEQAKKGDFLKKQFHITYESLKPISILKSTIKDINSSPILMTDVLGTSIGLATGYISKKIIIGQSDNILRKLLGTIVQISVTNTVARHPEVIRSIGKHILNYILSTKKPSSIKE